MSTLRSFNEVIAARPLARQPGGPPPPAHIETARTWIRENVSPSTKTVPLRWMKVLAETDIQDWRLGGISRTRRWLREDAVQVAFELEGFRTRRASDGTINVFCKKRREQKPTKNSPAAPRGTR